MTEEMQNSDPVFDGILAGLRRAEQACFLTQAKVANSRPIGQVAAAMVSHIEDALTGELPPELAPDDDVDFLERSVAIIAAVAALVASDLAGALLPDSETGPEARHDANRALSRASDNERTNPLKRSDVATLMDNLVDGYQEERSNHLYPNGVFQIEINEGAASAVEAKSITSLGAPLLNFLKQQSHATFFIRHRVLSPWRTEWTDWELSGGGELGQNHFSRPLKVEGIDHWIDFQVPDTYQ